MASGLASAARLPFTERALHGGLTWHSKQRGTVRAQGHDVGTRKWSRGGIEPPPNRPWRGRQVGWTHKRTHMILAGISSHRRGYGWIRQATSCFCSWQVGSVEKCQPLPRPDFTTGSTGVGGRRNAAAHVIVTRFLIAPPTVWQSQSPLARTRFPAQSGHNQDDAVQNHSLAQLTSRQPDFCEIKRAGGHFESFLLMPAGLARVQPLVAMSTNRASYRATAS